MGLVDRAIALARDVVGRLAPPTMGETAPSDLDATSSSSDAVRPYTDEVLLTHGGGDLALYEKLLQDDQVYPTFRQRRASIVARETRVEPGGDAPIDIAAADFVRQQLANVSWDRATYKMLTGAMYGYGVAECIWGSDGPRTTLKALRVRKSKRFRFAPDNALLLLRQGEPTPVPPNKFWVATFESDDDDDPYGRGLGYWLHWPCFFKRNGLKFWVVFLERFSQGVPMAKVPVGTTDAERNKLLHLLEAVTGAGKIVIPKNIDLEILQALKDSGGDYEKFIGRLDASIAKIVLLQTMTTDDGGSLSQARVHLTVAEIAAKSDSDVLTESFQQGPARWLTEWNFPGAKVPRIYRDFGRAEDLDALASRDTQLLAVGYRPTADRIQEVYGDGYERVPAMPTDPAAAFAEAERYKANSIYGRVAAAQRTAEASFAAAPIGSHEGVSELLDNGNWQEVLGPQVAEIEQLTDQCSTLEEMRERLGDLALTDPTVLAQSLARVMFAARLAGNTEAEPDDGPEATDER